MGSVDVGLFKIDDKSMEPPSEKGSCKPTTVNQLKEEESWCSGRLAD